MIFRKMNEIFQILFKRMKLFSTTSSAAVRTSSPDVTTDINECLESGGIFFKYFRETRAED
jgi:hypothetical protein